MTDLATWMQANGETDESLAPKIGVSRVHVSRLRRKLYRPSPELAVRIEGVTGIAWHALIAPAGAHAEAFTRP